MTTEQGLDIAIFGEALADVFPDRTVIGGAPLNVARHLNALDMHPVFITRLGEDELKQTLLETFNAEALDTTGVQTDPVKPTGKVMVTLVNGEPSYEIVPDQAYDHIHEGMTHLTMMSIKPVLKYFGTLAQRNTVSRVALETFINDKPAPAFLDLNLREPWYDAEIIERALTRCDYAKMNAGELKTICRMMDIEGESEEVLARALMVQFKLKQIIITCGGDGCWALDEKLNLIQADAAPLPGEMADTVGAGDGFAAIFLLGIALDWPTKQTMERANAFASAICTLRGAAPASKSFYDTFKDAWQ